MRKIEHVAQLARLIDGTKITFLVGAGFSASAGIPLAGAMVNEMRTRFFTKKELETAPTDSREYAFLMRELGASRTRNSFLSEMIDLGGNKLNWCHLLLARMVERGKVAHVLTTNFDPLMVKALAVTGQDIRTYDVRTSNGYEAGVLTSTSVVYLHGQIHSILLVNSDDEARDARPTYREVLKEAVSSSCLIIVGYSGVNDELFRTLDEEFREFRNGLYWSNYSPKLDDGVRAFLERHRGTNYLTGYSADRFMRELVIEAMNLDLPDLFKDPLGALATTLERITEFPTEDGRGGGDPAKVALSLLRELKKVAAKRPETRALAISKAALSEKWPDFERLRKGIKPDKRSITSKIVGDGFLRRSEAAIRKGRFQDAIDYIVQASQFGVLEEGLLFALNAIAIASRSARFGDPAKRKSELRKATNEFRAAIKRLDRKGVRNGAPNTQRANVYYNWAMAVWEHARMTDSPAERQELLGDADAQLGKAAEIAPAGGDLLRNWGAVLNMLAKLKHANSGAAEAAAFWERSSKKFAQAEALEGGDYRIYHNWGVALSDQATFMSDSPGRTELFAQARNKFQLAVEGGPKEQRVHKTHFSWGMTFVEEARLVVDRAIARDLLAQAADHFRETLDLEPGFGPAHFGKACVEALSDPPNVRVCVSELKLWRRGDPTASRAIIDDGRAFDAVRDEPGFRELVASFDRPLRSNGVRISGRPAARSSAVPADW
jgi:hypothetical protein